MTIVLVTTARVRIVVRINPANPAPNNRVNPAPMRRESLALNLGQSLAPNRARLGLWINRQF